ncbi:ATP-binding cassette subfamily B protein [Micromonospora sp. Llam0]|uniref:ABC transporter ATP-binding protein n=1 Tax=Micromonospora sp. Llam0 TaxID=2485143 RepID=UPI000F487E9E|nr:ABC transporter ATP-binding protein [Micromonospora sp. Llam0]ROO60482.1 ATP-binding cassette subfamily B protein [Micromonospora sp. Llam0]
MIRQLRAVLGPQDQRLYTRFLIWATAYGVLQGVAIVFLVPIARALIAGDYPATLAWLGGMLVAVLACSVAHYTQAMLGYQVAVIVLKTMHLNIGDHLVKLPIGWFAGKVGRVAQVASKGTLAVGGGAAHLMTPLITGIAGPATVTVAMFFLDWRLGLTLLAAAPVVALASRGASRLISRSDAAVHAAAVEANDRVIEFARAQGVLRAFGRSAEGYEPLEDATQRQRVAVRRNLVESVLGLILSGVAIQLTFSIFIVLAASFALGGTLTGAELIALLGVMARFVQPLNEIGEYGGSIRSARSELARIQEIMDATPLPEPDGAATVVEPGAIEFDAVRFGYRTGEPVLNGISFRVPPRTMTALVGPSGSGKTTVTRLIARFYDIDAGTVRVGGVDVRDQRADDLMAQLSLVFQDVYLFDDTLRENVRIGNPAATEEEIDRAAHLAGVSEIAARLPHGWNTKVGEAGSALSGGERQRVSIARAILKNTPIVLLDEATAALDPENEAYVQDSMRTLMARSTLLVIAHKLSTVMAADQIVVLGDDGSVVERGRHDELLAAGGRYADFWHERDRARGWTLQPAQA